MSDAWDPIWDSTDGNRWSGDRPVLDRARSGWLLLAVLSNTAAWTLLFAVVYKNPGPFVYITGAVIAVLLLLVGLVLPHTVLVLAGLWALVSLAFHVPALVDPTSLTVVPFDLVTIVIVVIARPWARRDGSISIGS